MELENSQEKCSVRNCYCLKKGSNLWSWKILKKNAVCATVTILRRALIYGVGKFLRKMRCALVDSTELAQDRMQW